MSDGFKSFGDIIKKNPELNNIRKVIDQSDVILDFNKIFPELKKVASAVKVNKNTLFLKVNNAAWRNELKLKEESIIKKINEFYSEERINFIRFVAN